MKPQKKMKEKHLMKKKKSNQIPNYYHPAWHLKFLSWNVNVGLKKENISFFVIKAPQLWKFGTIMQPSSSRPNVSTQRRSKASVSTPASNASFDAFLKRSPSLFSFFPFSEVNKHREQKKKVQVESEASSHADAQTKSSINDRRPAR